MNIEKPLRICCVMTCLITKYDLPAPGVPITRRDRNGLIKLIQLDRSFPLMTYFAGRLILYWLSSNLSSCGKDSFLELNISEVNLSFSNLDKRAPPVRIKMYPKAINAK